MFKNFLSANIYYLISSIFGKGAIFFLLPVITRLLTPAEFGIIDYILVIAAFVYLVAGIETRQGVARFFPETEEHNGKVEIASTQLLFIVGCYFFFVLVSIIFYHVFPLQNISLSLYVSVVAAITMNGIWQNVHSIFRWNFRYKEYAFLEILYFLLVYGGAILFIRQFHFSSEGYFLGMLFGASLTTIIGIYLQRNLLKIKFDKKVLNNLVTYSGPLVFAALAAIASSYVDRIFIKNLMSLKDLGIYGVGFRVASIVLILTVAFQSALTPLIFKHHEDASTPRKLAFLSKVFLFFFVGIIAFFSIFSEILIQFFAPESYKGAEKIVPLIVMSIIFFKVYIFTPGLSIAKKTNIILYIQVITLVLNGVLNYLMIPTYGIQGAAIATLISSVFLLFVNIYFSQQYYYIPYDGIRILFFTLVNIILIVVFYNLKNNIDNLLIQSALILPILLSTVLILFRKEELSKLIDGKLQ